MTPTSILCLTTTALVLVPSLWLPAFAQGTTTAPELALVTSFWYRASQPVKSRFTETGLRAANSASGTQMSIRRFGKSIRSRSPFCNRPILPMGSFMAPRVGNYQCGCSRGGKYCFSFQW